MDKNELRQAQNLAKVKIYAYIAKQREVLEFLEYSLEQKEARKDQQIYVNFITKSSDRIYNTFRTLLHAERDLEELED